MNRTMLATLLGLATLGWLANADAIAAEEHHMEKPTISVSGTGRISSAPDVAEIQVGVRSQAETAKKALAANNEAMNALFTALKERGVAAKDIETTQVQVSPQYSQPAPRVQPRRPDAQEENEFIPRIIGYRVDNTVQITVRQIDKMGAMLDATVEAGANQIHSISFRVDKPEKLMEEARKQAMADAKRKADTLAGEAGVVVGFPIKIEDDAGSPPPAPRFMGRAAMMAAPAPMPIAGGEQEISVTVHVVYELKHAK
jgi:uncharacterized protein YggE